ncbi:MAG: PilW family protein [Reinekea sp.]|jgi:type IV pilus assembly protein PilW
MKNNNYRQSGLTLVEILIALVLSAIIITGIVQVFISNRQAYSLTESTSRVQENGRFAISLIAESIRNAGNFGCLPENSRDFDSLRNWVSALRAADQSVDLNPIQTNNQTALDNTTDGGTVANWFDSPDTLTLLIPTGTSGGRLSSVLVNSGTGDKTLKVNGGNFFQSEIVLASNCNVGDIIQLGNVTQDVANDTWDLVDATKSIREDFYNLGNVASELMQIRFVEFSVDATSNTLVMSTVGDGAAAQVQPLVSGIENIQFQYGVDNNGDYVADYFDTITNISNLSNAGSNPFDSIVAVKVFVLAVHGDNGGDGNTLRQPQTISFAGQNRTVGNATDLRLRRVYETTVNLRNRMD